MERHREAAFDLRIFLDEVRSTGELREISGAHWKLEIGALTELFAEQNFTPALLFDYIQRMRGPVGKSPAQFSHHTCIVGYK